MSSGNKKLLSVIIKAGILIMAAIFIYHKLNNNNNLLQFNQLLNELSVVKVYTVLSSVLVLMLVNWVLEAFKWKFLVRQIQKINTRKAIESVFCGLTLAIFTPNRIGEYGGRVFFLSPRKRIPGAIAMGVGAVGQMVVTNVLGSLAVLWFAGNFLELSYWLYYAWFFLTMVFCLLFLFFYFNIRWLGNILNSITFFKRFQRFFFVLSRYKKKSLIKVFMYSLARYAVFTSQYCLIIHLLLPEMDLFPMIMMIFILFFIQSALPSLDLLDVGVRSMTATYFFSFITDQDVAIMASTACIWFVNLIIPAILGAGFVFKLNIFGTNTN
ncbi:lysylphosphatidylglycerol synthase domain-containing protein [Rubrolithibacter danxiaensis]|uniref:lysylphosphatidylglycerol synthase domain-containing protein n=1 Tax=Rubrolithibacter danxiaensis TaxID=3390805 RepID=UPI003BF77C80